MALRDALARRDLSKTQKYLLILSHQDGPSPSSEIRKVAKENGWRDGANSQPHAFLSKSQYAISLPRGWALSGPGRLMLEKSGLLSVAGILTPVTADLERFLTEVDDSNKRRFIDEAVTCVKNKCYRAAIVLTWVGAVYLLYDHVLSKRLREFKTEVSRRWPKQKSIATIDDLASMKESDFLSVIEHICIISKAEHKELTNCLDRRNTAGHPNSHDFAEVVVGAHIHALISTVYAKY